MDSRYIDLEKFFDNVPQDKLMSLVHNIINDGDTESLIRKYLKAGVMTPQGYEETRLVSLSCGTLSKNRSKSISTIHS